MIWKLCLFLGLIRKIQHSGFMTGALPVEQAMGRGLIILYIERIAYSSVRLDSTFRNPFVSCRLGCYTEKTLETQLETTVGTVTHCICNLLQAFF